MTVAQFFESVSNAETLADIEQAVETLERAEHSVAWVPVGRENNRGTIEVSADPGRSLVERLTNGVDAILEAEHEIHRGIPDCRSPKDAAIAWLGIPSGGLNELTPAQRRELSRRVTVRLLPGEARESRTVEVRDFGIGLAPEEMPATILSLNESNKLRKHYLAGTYGQGGSSTFAVSKLTLIVSRKSGTPETGFTIVRFLDLPADQYKTGHYVYLTLADRVPHVELPESQFPPGTLVRHFGYDLINYSSPLGPNSVYGLLNQILFDPVIPVWLDNRVHNFRRVIKGSRSALNGALDEGDDARGPSLSHSVRLFYVSLGEFGRIGVEYWVLEAPSQTNKRPIAAFLNPAKPLILTLNGQDHGEMPQSLVKKEADLPYLALRLICHIDCNSLTPTAKRQLFVSNREEARGGAVYQLVESEVVRILKSDDDLVRLNNEARERGTREQDQVAVAEMRREVARLLLTHGLDIAEPVGAHARGGDETERPVNRPPGRRTPPRLIELREPPTYIRLLWGENERVTFYPEQRRYLRIETDANSIYHDPSNPSLSRINIAVTGLGALVARGSTPLQGGRMRAIVEAGANSEVGQTGIIRVELIRVGLPGLSDERDFAIVERPPATPAEHRISLPPFDIRPVDPDTDLWATLGWPEDVSTIASSALMEDDRLVVFYSTAFPRYAGQLRDFERSDPTLAASFTERYKIWLVTHSLLLHRDQSVDATRPPASDEEEHERAERCRIAAMAALFARREVRSQSDSEQG